jgi:hypothetical protein
MFKAITEKVETLFCVAAGALQIGTIVVLFGLATRFTH